MRSFEGFETLCLVSIYVHTLSLPSYLLTWGLNIRREKALGRKKRKAYLHPKTCLFSIFLTGASIQGRSQIWMDANGGEVTLWQQMLERPNFWVEGSVPLRTSDKLQGGSAWRLEKTNEKKTESQNLYLHISTSLLLLTNMTTLPPTNNKTKLCDTLQQFIIFNPWYDVFCLSLFCFIDYEK